MNKKINDGIDVVVAAYDGPPARGPDITQIIGISDKASDVLALASREGATFDAWAANYLQREQAEFAIIDQRFADHRDDDDRARQVHAQDRAKAKAEWRRVAFADVEPKILPTVKSMFSLLDRVRDTRQVINGPLVLADQCGLGGDEEFDRKARRVADADVNSLRNSIAFAINTKDKKLLAACIRRLETFSKQERERTGFSPAQLAEVGFGDDYKALTATLLQIELKAKAVVSKWRGAQSPSKAPEAVGIARTTSGHKISAGLAQRLAPKQ